MPGEMSRSVKGHTRARTHTIIAAGQAGEGCAHPEALGTGVVGSCTQGQGAGAPHSLGLALPSTKQPMARDSQWPVAT